MLIDICWLLFIKNSKKKKCREIYSEIQRLCSYDTGQLFVPFVQTRKAIGMVWTVTVQNWNKSFSRWHRTSCRNGWPRGFGSLIPNPLTPEYLFRVPVLFLTYLFPLRSKYLHTTPKCGRQNLYDAPLSRSARRSYRNGAKITVRMCEQKPYQSGMTSGVVWLPV